MDIPVKLTPIPVKLTPLVRNWVSNKEYSSDKITVFFVGFHQLIQNDVRYALIGLK